MDRFVAITTQDKQRSLEDAVDYSAQNNNLPVRQVLRQFEGIANGAVNGGFVISSSSSNAHSASIALGGSMSASPAEYAVMWRDLINLFDRAKLWLQDPPSCVGEAPEPITDPTDAQIVAKMQSWLYPLTESHNDYGNLRLTGAAYV